MYVCEQVSLRFCQCSPFRTAKANRQWARRRISVTLGGSGDHLSDLRAKHAVVQPDAADMGEHQAELEDSFPCFVTKRGSLEAY